MEISGSEAAITVASEPRFFSVARIGVARRYCEAVFDTVEKNAELLSFHYSGETES